MNVVCCLQPLLLALGSHRLSNRNTDIEQMLDTQGLNLGPLFLEDVSGIYQCLHPGIDFFFLSSSLLYYLVLHKCSLVSLNSLFYYPLCPFLDLARYRRMALFRSIALQATRCWVATRTMYSNIRLWVHKPVSYFNCMNEKMVSES